MKKIKKFLAKKKSEMKNFSSFETVFFGVLVAGVVQKTKPVFFGV
jgi:hypothetical protein